MEFILLLTSVENMIVLNKFCPHRLAWLGRVLLRHVTPVQIRLGVRFWLTPMGQLQTLVLA